jgi:hypothetical protein
MSTAHDLSPERPRPWLAHLRGVLVALHVLAVTLMALPTPGEGMIRSAWKDPTAQAEFAVWTQRCNALGWAITQDQFEDLLWNLASEYMRVRGILLTPFGPYYTYCGTGQGWAMFAGPHRYPGRVEIDVQEQGAWRPVYIQRDPQYAWLSGKLDHYRLRPQMYRFAWYPHTEDYHDFAAWIARTAARDFPEADTVRVRMFKYRTLTPEEVRAGARPEGTYVKEEKVELRPLR